jgi:hypothetical protein
MIAERRELTKPPQESATLQHQRYSAKVRFMQNYSRAITCSIRAGALFGGKRAVYATCLVRASSIFAACVLLALHMMARSQRKQ